MSNENKFNHGKIDYVAAIDIGTTKIVAIAGQKLDNGRIKILGVGEAESHGVKRGVVQNIEETSSAIKKAVAIAEQQAGFTFKHVVVGIAGQHIKSLANRSIVNINNPDSEIRQEHLDDLVENMRHISLSPGEEILHIIPQSYKVDNESGITSNVIGMYGKRLEGNFHIVVGQTTSAKNIAKCIERANLVLDSMVLEPLASADAVLTDEEKEAGVAMVDIGGGTTDLALYHDKIIRQTAVVPFGGAIITQDIKEGLQIIARTAEELKVKHGHALSDTAPANEVISLPTFSGQLPKKIAKKQLALIIQARLEEIIEAIKFELSNSGYYDRLGAGVVLTGGGSLVKDLQHLFRFQTGLEVRLALPNELFSIYNDSWAQPKYSTALGLIKKAYEYYEKNGIPKDEEVQQEVDNQEEKEDKDLDNDPLEKVGKKFSKFLKGLFDTGDTDMTM